MNSWRNKWKISISFIASLPFSAPTVSLSHSFVTIDEKTETNRVSLSSSYTTIIIISNTISAAIRFITYSNLGLISDASQKIGTPSRERNDNPRTPGYLNHYRASSLLCWPHRWTEKLARWPELALMTWINWMYIIIIIITSSWKNAKIGERKWEKAENDSTYNGSVDSNLIFIIAASGRPPPPPPHNRIITAREY